MSGHVYIALMARVWISWYPYGRKNSEIWLIMARLLSQNSCILCDCPFNLTKLKQERRCLASIGTELVDFYLNLCGEISEEKRDYIETELTKGKLYFCRKCSDSVISLNQQEKKLKAKKENILTVLSSSVLVKFNDQKSCNRQLFAATPTKRLLGESVHLSGVAYNISPGKVTIRGLKRAPSPRNTPKKRSDKKATPLKIKYTPRKTGTTVKVNVFPMF